MQTERKAEELLTSVHLVVPVQKIPGGAEEQTCNLVVKEEEQQTNKQTKWSSKLCANTLADITSTKKDDF